MLAKRIEIISFKRPKPKGVQEVDGVEKTSRDDDEVQQNSNKKK